MVVGDDNNGHDGVQNEAEMGRPSGQSLSNETENIADDIYGTISET